MLGVPRRAMTTRRGAGRPRREASALVLLASLSALSPLTSVFILPALPALAADLSTSLAAAQLSLSVGLAGLAVGLLLVGPLSDRFGRRRPLMVGLLCYVVTTMLCAFAGDIGALVVFRLLQGVAGGAVWVITRAVVRDAYSGAATARVYSQMAMIAGVAPVIAPVIAGQLLLVMDWRGLFVALAAVGVVVTSFAAFFMRETLDADRRQAGGLRAQFRITSALVRSRHFVLLVILGVLHSSMNFTFVIMSPFAFTGDFGMDAQAFSLLYAGAALAMVLGNQTNVLLLRRWGSETVLRGLLLVALAGAIGFLIAVSSGSPLAVVIALLLPVPFASGASNANITALTLAPYPRMAGTAAAFLGACQFGVAALVPPLVSLFGVGALTMGAALVVTAFATWLMGLSPMLRRPAAAADPIA